jgi:hypothetical protein
MRKYITGENGNKIYYGEDKRCIAKTIKEYKVNFKGYDLVVPVGSKVSNNTACGVDDNYRFWIDFQKTAQEITGFKDSFLVHDLTHYGLNIPAEYCEPYKIKD